VSGQSSLSLAFYLGAPSATVQTMVRRLGLGRSRFRFSGGIDHISSLRFPPEASFIAQDTRRVPIFGLSALAFCRDLATLCALCDRSAILAGTVSFDNVSLELINLDWNAWLPVHTRSGEPIDAEGLAFLPNGSTAVSGENPAAIYTTCPFLPPPYVCPLKVLQRENRTNGGMESLASIPPNAGVITPRVAQVSLVTAFEYPGAGDDASVWRLIELDATTGEKRYEVAFVVDTDGAFVIDSGGAPLHLTEVVALDSAGLSGGGQLLALMRALRPDMTNEIRLYLLDAANASDVRFCPTIMSGDGASASSASGTLLCCSTMTPTSLGLRLRRVTSACVGGSEVSPVTSELLLRWTAELPLGGTVPPDNYEGMAVVPPEMFGRERDEDLGGIVVLLVNDNNGNPSQCCANGTQFVSLRLAFAMPPQPVMNALVSPDGSPSRAFRR